MAEVEVTTGEKLKAVFRERGEVNAWLAYQLLGEDPDFRGSYGRVVRLFYSLREIGLIEFVREAPSRTDIPKRFYMAVPELLDDPRWRRPFVELYPGAALGGLSYVPGASGGRNERYKKT